MPVKMFVLKNLGNGGLWNLLMKGLLRLIEADVASGLGLFIHAVKHRWAIVSLANYGKQSILSNMKSYFGQSVLKKGSNHLHGSLRFPSCVHLF